jgi:hypothetical protein
MNTMASRQTVNPRPPWGAAQSRWWRGRDELGEDGDDFSALLS